MMRVKEAIIFSLFSLSLSLFKATFIIKGEERKREFDRIGDVERFNKCNLILKEEKTLKTNVSRKRESSERSERFKWWLFLTTITSSSSSSSSSSRKIIFENPLIDRHQDE